MSGRQAVKSVKSGIGLKFGQPLERKGRTFSTRVPLILAQVAWTYVTRYSSVFLGRVPGRDANSPCRQASVLPETDEKRASERGCRMLDPSERVNPRKPKGIVDRGITRSISLLLFASRCQIYIRTRRESVTCSHSCPWLR